MRSTTYILLGKWEHSDHQKDFRCTLEVRWSDSLPPKCIEFSARHSFRTSRCIWKQVTHNLENELGYQQGIWIWHDLQSIKWVWSSTKMIFRGISDACLWSNISHPVMFVEYYEYESLTNTLSAPVIKQLTFYHINEIISKTILSNKL